ncbi:MAG: hypothetical protein DWQ06_06310 [Calditrichaeota bacterium]|nr:MAG: hypothetical protein DWQ06_06310 [Calditrichota bacterium]
MILTDGARPDVMNELIQRGEMPNLCRHVIENGDFSKATSVFPSTTGPAYVPLLMGLFPGTANMPGIRWFDKKQYAKSGWNSEQFRSYVGVESFLMNSDLNPNFKTLFEIFPNSASVFNSVTRGVKPENELGGKIRFLYWLYAHWTHHWTFIDRMAIEHLVEVAKRKYKFSFVVFPGVDAISHVSHPRAEKVIQAYHDLDSGIGRLAEELKNQGNYESTGILVTADHGLSKTETHFGIPEFFMERKVKTLYHPKIFNRNPKITVAISGNGMANVYVKPQSGDWADFTPHEELKGYVEELINSEPIELAITRNSENEILITGKEGVGSLDKISEDEITYNFSGNDPLRIGDLPNRMTLNESLEHTFDSDFPDALAQIVQIFKSSRTGDLLLSAKEGFDLREAHERPEHFSSHGALSKNHMSVPFLTNFKVNRRFIRTADAFPTILELLGEEVPSGIDGRSLVSEIKELEKIENNL